MTKCDLWQRNVMHFSSLEFDNEAAERIMELLVAAGGDVNIVNDAGETPLMSAVMQDNVAFVRALLIYGARMDIESRNGRTALDLARFPRKPCKRHYRVIGFFENDMGLLSKIP